MTVYVVHAHFAGAPVPRFIGVYSEKIEAEEVAKAWQCYCGHSSIDSGELGNIVLPPRVVTDALC